MPPSNRAAVRGHARTVASNLRYLQLAQTTSAALARAGIPVLLLKGSAYLDTLYELSERPMYDIDILVPMRRRPEARELLLREGYRFWEPPASHSRSWESHYCWQFHSPCGGLLELHGAFCQRGRYRIDYDALWSRCVVHSADGRSVPTLSPEDSLLYAAVHEAKHAYFVPERSREDVRRIVEQWRPRWTEVVARAREWGAAVTVFVTLVAAVRHGAAIPPWVMRALAPRPLQRAAVQSILRLEGDCAPRLGGERPWVQLLTALTVADRKRQNVALLSHYTLRRARDLLPARS